MSHRFLFAARSFIFCIFMLISQHGHAQPNLIPADVYQWKVPPIAGTDRTKSRVIIEGATPAFSFLEVQAVTIAPDQTRRPGQTLHSGHTYADEELIIVKEGELTITINDENPETLEAGSIAFIMPDQHSFTNLSNQPVTFYVMRYHTLGAGTKSRAVVGQSFVKHWKDLEYKPNDKGGRRNVFDQKTNEAERFEMHITTLNTGLMSHPPHTHQAAEILLLVEGQAEESIDGKWVPAQVGDIIFLQSQVPHAIRNTGKEACTYFAFQFE